MSKLSHLAGMSLLALSISWPALAEGPRSIKIGAARTNEAPAIFRKMKETPLDDDLFGPVVVRAEGRAIHNMYILKAKSPAASKSKWDLLEQVGVLGGPEAFRPVDEGGCSLV
jgi:branched-chain amino acid transport system substrate-binding protein